MDDNEKNADYSKSLSNSCIPGQDILFANQFLEGRGYLSKTAPEMIAPREATQKLTQLLFADDSHIEVAHALTQLFLAGQAHVEAAKERAEKRSAPDFPLFCKKCHTMLSSKRREVGNHVQSHPERIHECPRCISCRGDVSEIHYF